MDHYVDLKSPEKRQALSVTTPWAGSPEYECVRVEVYVGDDSGNARTIAELRVQFYTPEVVDELVVKLKEARDRLWGPK